MSQPDLPIRGDLVIAGSELGWRFSRASGPGGQGVNTTDSRVELVFPLASSPSLPEHLRARALQRLEGRLVDGTIVVVAAEHRSQWRNRQAALQRLASLLREAIAAPSPSRRPTRPTRGSVERRLQAKRLRGRIKGARRGRPSLSED